MTAHKLFENAAGRLVPAQINGEPAIPFLGVGKSRPAGRKAAPPVDTSAEFPDDGNKVAADLKAALREVGVNVPKSIALRPGEQLQAVPLTYPLVVKIPSTGVRKQIDITVRSKDFGVRRLTLPKEMVDLDAVTLERVKREAATMKEVLEAPPTVPQWKGPFVKPLSGEVVGTFGQASIINGMPRSPHSGVDLKAEKGTPVVSINSGRVALTGEHFFNGLFVVVDHGGAVQSMYFHLDKILVQQGDKVAKGMVVGLVGATGRATGPHLHFGVRINGARIDPMQFMKVNEAMERL